MKAIDAIKIIQDCLATDRYHESKHFRDRLSERNLFWPDVLTVINHPDDVQSSGDDDYGRPKWILAGQAADGLDIEIVAVLDQDVDGHWTLLITIYFED